MNRLKQRTLIVIASTYPRWANDTVPNFVENFVNQIKGSFGDVRVIAPHYARAKHKERPDQQVSITRFRYFWPYSQENIAYGEFKKDKLYPLKSLLYIASELHATFWASIFGKQVIVNAHWLIPQGFVAVLLKPIFRNKVVISIHGADVFTLNGGMMRKIKRFTLRHADAVITNSSATQGVCQELYDRDYPIIPMGVDLQRFKRPSGLSWQTTAGKPFELLFVGRVVEAKGLLYLCQAVKLLRQQHVSVHLTIVGDGEARESIVEYITSNNLEEAITLAGWIQQENLAAYYANANAFVGPSIQTANGWKEAFGVVFAEASAMGLPIITTDTGGIKDIVKHELNGLVVPQKDAPAIAAAVARLQSDPELCRILGEQGSAYIAQNFSWEVIASKYIKVLEAL